MDAKGRGPRRTIGFALSGLIGLVVVVGVVQGQGPVYGRFEVGSPVEGIVALVDASAPENDPFHGQFCGGVVVAERTVLTAAHCIADREREDIDVIINADNLCRYGPIDGMRVRAIAQHIDERWDPTLGTFDLAWLRVDENSGAGITIARPSTVAGDATAFGWGASRTMGNGSCRLTATTVRIAEGAACKSLVGEVLGRPVA